MHKIGDFKSERNKLLQEARDTISDVKKIVTKVRQIDNIKEKEAVDILSTVRDRCYENLNIIPHDLMILQAADWIKKRNYPHKAIEWHWNRAQTSKKEEADLHGKIDGKIVVSAEITTSAKPIYKKMAQTLKKLNEMQVPGKKIYFVQTKDMKKPADAEIKEKGYKIKVEIIQLGT